MTDSPLLVNGLRVLVTAGAAGIGRAIVDTFIEHGARVHVCDVSVSALPSPHRGLATRAGRIQPISALGQRRTSRTRGQLTPGLRREEVAELLEISAIWYRWFESGAAPTKFGKDARSVATQSRQMPDAPFMNGLVDFACVEVDESAVDA